MKVLLCIRSDYYRHFAGDSMQVIKTQEYLRKKGVTVDINDGVIYDFSSYDIVHLFNLKSMGEIYKYYKQAVKQRKNIVITPVYWDMTKYYNYIKDEESLKLWNQCRVYREEILKRCKRIYPSSYLEQQIIASEFGDNLHQEVIYNGVEVEDEEVPLYNFKERYNLNNYVLCVGRIYPQKNQLVLSKLCYELGLQLVLIGSCADKEYFNECMKYDNVRYFGFMDSYNIYNAYRFAKLHILPSFVETPGMSSMEAAASGCTIISTEEGSAKEYFNDLAIYCNPYDENSIREALEKGIKKFKSSKLKKHVLDNFNWEDCIEELYKSYVSILGS